MIPQQPAVEKYRCTELSQCDAEEIAIKLADEPQEQREGEYGFHDLRCGVEHVEEEYLAERPHVVHDDDVERPGEQVYRHDQETTKEVFVYPDELVDDG